MFVGGTGFVKGTRETAGASLDAHLKYMRYRSGEAEVRTLFTELADDVSLGDAHVLIMDHGRTGLRYHKIVISPGASEQVADWRAFTRAVMNDLSQKMRLDLTWCATVHHNTDHAHVHIVLAGDGQRASDGQVLQARLYVPEYTYLRERATWHTEQAWDRALMWDDRLSVSAFYASSGTSSQGESHSLESVLEHFSAVQHTATSQVIWDKVADGTINIILDASLDGYGSARGGGRIRLNPKGTVDHVLSTLVHEAQHDLDIAAGIVPPPSTATPFERGLAEARAFWAEGQFAQRNGWSELQAFKLVSLGPKGLVIALSEDQEYGAKKEIGTLDDSDLRRIAESLE